MVRRAVLWTFFGQALSVAFSFLGSIAIARLLSPHELGIFAVAMATIGVLQIVASFGVGLFVVRQEVLSEEAFDTAFTVNLILSVALAALIAGASIPIALFLKEPAVAPVLAVLSLSPLIGIPAFRSSTMLTRDMQFGSLAFLGVLGTTLSTGTTVVSAWLGASSMSPAYGSLASGVAGAIATIALAPRYVSFRMSLAGWRPIATFGLQIMSINGIAVAAVRLSDILVGRLIGLSALGLISRASNLSNIVLTYVYSGAMRIVYAQLAKDYRERGVVRDTFVPGLRMIAGLMGPMMIGIAILSRPMVFTLYGQKWMAAAPLLALMMIAQFVSLSFAMNWELYLVRDKLALQVKYEGARSIFGVVSNVIGCAFGVVGVAASSIVDAVFSAFLYLPTMGGLADSNRGELTRIYFEAVLLTITACLPTALLMYFRHWSPQTSWIEIVGAVTVGGVGWLGLLFATAHPLAREMRHLGATLLRLPKGAGPAAG